MYAYSTVRTKRDENAQLGISERTFVVKGIIFTHAWTMVATSLMMYYVGVKN